MSRSLTGVVEWATAHPTRPGGATWDEWCEAFVDDSGGFTRSFPSATKAQAASHVFPPSHFEDVYAVPDGWALWFDFPGPGHVAWKVGKRALMASAYIHDHGTLITPHALALGYIDPVVYAKASGHAWLGASPDHGGEFLLGVQRAYAKPLPKPPVVAPTPAPTPAPVATPEEDEVPTLFKGKDKPEVYALVGGHKRHVTPAEATILKEAGTYHVTEVPQAEADAIPAVS